MKLYNISKNNKLICKKRFTDIKHIKKYLKENNKYGQFDIIEYNLKDDHKLYKICVNRNDKNEIL